MAAPPIPNRWFLRRVAEKSSKACWICYKSSSSVLITPDNKDFFYICPGHLKDRSFCTPDEAEAAANKEKLEKQAKEELEREKEKIIKEYEEKKKRRDERKKDKDKKKKDKEDKKEEKKDEEEEKKDTEEKDKKIKEIEEKKEKAEEEDGPRIFALGKVFYTQRINRIRNAEQAKRTQELIRNPTSFPSVPKGIPSGQQPQQPPAPGGPGP